MPDDKWGEIVTACIVLASEQTVSAAELLALRRRTLAHYKVRRRLEFSNTALPKSSAGTVLKRLLRERSAPPVS